MESSDKTIRGGIDDGDKPVSAPVPLAPPHSVRLTTLPEHDCSYLPGRIATSRAFYADRLSPAVYHDFMDAGFRRSGKVIYQPTCGHCQACVPIRVLVNAFEPSKSQRRCERRNVDLLVTEGVPTSTDEKFELYRRYITSWHGKPVDADEDDRASFESFLYDSPVNTLEFNYRTKEGRLLAVGICDVCDQSFSSVYFYFDPEEHRRGLGTFGVLHELQWAKRAGIPYYYLGYWISGCGAMDYKARYHPHELLSPQGAWLPSVAFER